MQYIMTSKYVCVCVCVFVCVHTPHSRHIQMYVHTYITFMSVPFPRIQVLMLSHPHRDIRDTSKYKPFRQLSRVRLYRGRLVCCLKVSHLYQTTIILLRGAKQLLCHFLVRYCVLCQGFVLLRTYVHAHVQ